MHNIDNMPDYGIGKKKLGIYIIGVVLCILLTLIPFFTIMAQKFSVNITFAIIFIAAFFQFITQVFCFLRLNLKTKASQLNMMSFIIAIGMLMVIILGSLWIMWNLNYNMVH